MKTFDPKKFPKTLPGRWLVSRKVDGVQLVVRNGKYTSRAGKPLYNLPKGLRDGTYEIFVTDWNTTMSRVRASKSKRERVKRFDVYQLTPRMDSRLELALVAEAPTKLLVQMFNEQRKLGHEGLVLWPKDLAPLPGKRKAPEPMKMKPIETYDVRITEVREGKGKHKGRLGAFMTNAGRIGTGFNDRQREQLWRQRKMLLGKICEALAMRRNPSGKLTCPRFVRMRYDKKTVTK